MMRPDCGAARLARRRSSSASIPPVNRRGVTPEAGPALNGDIATGLRLRQVDGQGADGNVEGAVAEWQPPLAREPPLSRWISPPKCCGWERARERADGPPEQRHPGRFRCKNSFVGANVGPRNELLSERGDDSRRAQQRVRREHPTGHRAPQSSMTHLHPVVLRAWGAL